MNSARKNGWPVLACDNPTPTRLPEKPGIRKLFPVIDACPLCGGLHMTMQDFTQCKQSHAHRDQ